MSRRKPLTLKSLGLVEDSGELSRTFANTRTCFKLVLPQVLGYYIIGDGRRSKYRIAQIYRAEIYMRPRGGPNQMISSYEIGNYLNNNNGEPFSMNDGDALANLSATAIAALEVHASAAIEVHASRSKKKKR